MRLKGTMAGHHRGTCENDSQQGGFVLHKATQARDLASGRLDRGLHALRLAPFQDAMVGGIDSRPITRNAAILVQNQGLPR